MASILAVLTDIFDNFLLGEEGTLGTIAKRETAGMRHYKVKVSLWLNFISMSLPPSKYSKGMSMAALLERVLFPKEDFGEKSKKKRMRLKKPKVEGAEGGDKAAGQFSLPFQDQKNCQEINGKEAERKKIVENLDNEDSWSSDDGEGISVEELKETNGYKLFKEALQAHTKNSAKSV